MQFKTSSLLAAALSLASVGQACVEFYLEVQYVVGNENNITSAYGYIRDDAYSVGGSNKTCYIGQKRPNIDFENWTCVAHFNASFDITDAVVSYSAPWAPNPNYKFPVERHNTPALHGTVFNGTAYCSENPTILG